MTALPVPVILEGEVLTRRDDVRVVAALHPLRESRTELHVPAGSTLAEIVDLVITLPGCKARPKDFRLHLDGHPIEGQLWSKVRPKPGTTVALRPTVQGFLAPIFGALTAAFSSLGGLFSGFLGKLVMSAISFGAKLLLNLLFAPKPQKLEKPKESYSLATARNQAAPFEPIPDVLGRHRVSPFYGALPYTETIGDDQYLRLLFVWGYGPRQVEDIKIGETLLSSYDEVEIETRQGFPDDPPTTLYPKQVVEEPLNIKLEHSAGWQRRTTAENVTYITMDIVFPSGIVLINDKGKKGQWAVGFYIRYRLFGDTTWTDLPQLICRDQTQDTRRFTQAITVAAGQYEVEISRAQAEYEGEDFTISEDGYWTALRGFRVGEPLTFDKPLCISAIKIKATSQLNGSLDTLNGIVTSLVKSWNGTTWVDDQPSRNPADLVRHVLQGAANARPVADAGLDIVALQDWHDFCVLKGWTYDMPRVTAASVYDVVAEICAAGRAVPIFKDGKWSVVWDEEDTPIVQMFTPRNSWGFEAQHEFRELPHAWRVRFVNEKREWREDERIVYDDGYTAENATRFEGINFPGVTNPDLIWKHGRYHIAQLRLRPETYTFFADFEHLVCTRADRVRVAHDVMLVGLVSGRVKSANAGTQSIVVDEPVFMEGDKLYSVRFRKADGSIVLRSVITAAGEATTIAFTGSGTMPVGGDLFTFGEAGRETGVYRILSIEPQDELTARVTVVDDAPAINQADTGPIPAFDSLISVPFDPYAQPPSGLGLVEDVYQEGPITYAAVYLYWTPPTLGQIEAYEIEFRDNADPAQRWKPGQIVLAPMTTGVVLRLDPGTYSFRIRTRFRNGDVSRWIVSASFAVDSILNPPPDVKNFRISTLGDISTLSWSAILGPALTYEIRFVPTGGLSLEWNSAVVLVPPVSGASVQVPTMIGTYLIKAVYSTGLKSENPAAVGTDIAELAGMNVVELLTEDPSFAGTRIDVAAENGILRLLSNNVMAKWEALADVVSLYAGDGDDDSVGMAVSGSYYFDNNLDLGEVFTSRLTAVIDATGENLGNVMSSWATLADVAVMDDSSPDDWEVSLEFRTTLVNPALDDWSEWRPFIVGDVTARAFEFRVLLAGRSTGVDPNIYSMITPAVRMLRVQIDMPDRVIAQEDIVVPAVGLDVDFIPPFRSLHGIATADQDLATGDRKTITSKGADGFRIQFFDAGGTPVQRTIDYVAKGYGRMLQ